MSCFCFKRPDLVEDEPEGTFSAPQGVKGALKPDAQNHPGEGTSSAAPNKAKPLQPPDRESPVSVLSGPGDDVSSDQRKHKGSTTTEEQGEKPAAAKRDAPSGVSEAQPQRSHQLQQQPPSQQAPSQQEEPSRTSRRAAREGPPIPPPTSESRASARSGGKGTLYASSIPGRSRILAWLEEADLKYATVDEIENRPFCLAAPDGDVPPVLGTFQSSLRDGPYDEHHGKVATAEVLAQRGTQPTGLLLADIPIPPPPVMSADSRDSSRRGGASLSSTAAADRPRAYGEGRASKAAPPPPAPSSRRPENGTAAAGAATRAKSGGSGPSGTDVSVLMEDLLRPSARGPQVGESREYPFVGGGAPRVVSGDASTPPRDAALVMHDLLRKTSMLLRQQSLDRDGRHKLGALVEGGGPSATPGSDCLSPRKGAVRMLLPPGLEGSASVAALRRPPPGLLPSAPNAGDMRLRSLSPTTRLPKPPPRTQQPPPPPPQQQQPGKLSRDLSPFRMSPARGSVGPVSSYPASPNAMGAFACSVTDGGFSGGHDATDALSGLGRDSTQGSPTNSQ